MLMQLAASALLLLPGAPPLEETVGSGRDGVADEPGHRDLRAVGVQGEAYGTRRRVALEKRLQVVELLMCFDFARNLPETNALQNALRKKSGRFIMEAERAGHSEDVCTYVKADLGMMKKGVGPTGDPLPNPDVLLLFALGLAH